jgi:hypothetical protein
MPRQLGASCLDPLDPAGQHQGNQPQLLIWLRRVASTLLEHGETAIESANPGIQLRSEFRGIVGDQYQSPETQRTGS